MDKKELNEKEVFGSPIDNGETVDIRESISQMQTFLDETPSKKANNAKLVVIIVLIVIIIGLGGFIFYDKFLHKTKCKVKEVTVTTEDKYNDFLSNIKEREYAEYASFEYKVGEETKTRDYVLGTDNVLYILNNTSSEVTIKGATGNGGEFKGTKTDITNVVRIFIVNHASGTGDIKDEALGLLLLKEDGSLSIIRHPEKADIKEEELEDKYIVAAYTPVTNISKTVLIDIDGNTSILK